MCEAVHDPTTGSPLVRSTLHASRARRSWVAAPVLLLALSGCTGGDTQSTSADTAQTAEPAESGSPAGPSSPAPTAQAGETRWDEDTLVPAMKAAMEEATTAHVAMTTAAGGQSFTAEGDLAFRGRTQDMVLTVDGGMIGAGRVEVRLVDRVLYLAIPPMTPKGKFLEVRPGDEGSPMAGMLDQMGTLDPRQTFESFEEGLRKVTFVGEETVDGEQLQHYRLTVDLAKAAQAQGMPGTADMPRTIDYDVWLDDDARMRRIEMDVEQARTEMEMSDWGEPVTIEAPARSDIVEAPQRR
jgi:LppX_LprAFG lipoprotein